MKNHLKRLAMPRTWKLNRKEEKFIIRPENGKNLDLSMPLLPILRDLLGLVSTAKEARYVLKEGKVLLNHKKALKPEQSMGLFDVLSVADQHYRLKINERNQLYLDEITAAGSKKIISKVLGKTTLKKGKTQLNLLNGYNIIVPKDDYKINDTIELELPKMKITGKKEIKKGNKVLIFRGKHPSTIGTVEKIEDGLITIKSDKNTISTKAEYAVAI